MKLVTSSLYLLIGKPPSLGVLGFFVFCQVVNVMCASPDLMIASQPSLLSADRMVCPMDGTIMCPPLAISSPESQGRSNITTNVDPAPLAVDYTFGLTSLGSPNQWSRSRVLSLVPISIASSSVLRI